MIYLRKAEESDINLLFEWENDTDVRKNSFHSEMIDYSTHIKWFEKILAANDAVQFILMDDSIAVEQIRINIIEDIAEISYSIEANFRGKGYGKRIVKELEAMVETSYPQIQTLIARVKLDNIASKKVFECEGYELNSLKYEHFVNGRETQRVIFDFCFLSIYS